MPYDEFTLQHALMLFTGQKKVLKNSELNPMTFELYNEHRQEILIPQL